VTRGSSLRINEARFQKHFQELSRIGATPKGGIHRPTFSDAHTKARAWFKDRALEAGLEFTIDGAANHSAILRQEDAEKTLLIGSNLDSVCNGGSFDGALGVAAALEVLNTIKDANLHLPVHLEAIDFTDEEFTYIEFLGSRAFTGQLGAENLLIRSGLDDDFERRIKDLEISTSSIAKCGRNPSDYSGYLELHIEQGSRLENQGCQVGVVKSIVAIRSLQIQFHGRADHAGTTPMDSRRDAGLGAAAFTASINKLVLEHFPDCVLNVGNMTFFPGASNIVPERVDVTFELRSPEDLRAEELGEIVFLVSTEEAAQRGLDVEIKTIGTSKAVLLHSDLKEIINAVAEAQGLSKMGIASGAGHDAQILAGFTPTGMILVPSQGGISHNPKEFTNWKDCVNGANMLLGSVIRWANFSQ
jgi:N-carbamoyl-L-amino-acid hydrolase